MSTTHVLDTQVKVPCFCSHVDVGSYDNQVSMKNPFGTRHDGWVSIDSCIATEIAWLWASGVETLNSCCGHGKIHAWVIVAPESEPFMRERYGHSISHGGRPVFRMNSGTTDQGENK